MTPQAGLCGRTPPDSERLPVGTWVLPACRCPQGQALPDSLGCHGCKATWISSRFGPRISSYCHGQRETATNRIRTGVPEQALGHHSGNHLIHRFTYVQSTAPAVCNAGLYQPSPSRKGYQKLSQKWLFLRRCVKSCILCSEGSPPVARSGQISRIAAKNQAWVHG